MTSDHTIVERDGGVVTVTFNRPEKKNALTANNWMDLDQVLREIEDDPADRALVLTGAGGNFSSGADLSGGVSSGDQGDQGDQGGGSEGSSGGLTGRGRQLVLNEMRTVGGIIARLQRLPKPTIAAVDGVAVGVALGLAMACDLVVASDQARFSEVFVKRGLALDGGSSWTLPRLIGLRRAKQMTFFGDAIGAAQAEDWGLVNEVVAPEDLAATAAAWGQRLASGPPTALGLIKRLLDSGGTSSFEEAIEDEARAQHIVFTTEDMREGILAFFERREPNFQGR